MSTIPDPVELTQTLVRMDTINPPGNEAPAARYLGKMFEEAGLTVSYAGMDENRTGLIAVLNGNPSRPPLVFTGHLDTVPIGEAPWTSPPHEARIHDGRLIGRGASDMKGGIAAMTVMALQLAREKEREGDVVLVYTAAEETGCEGALHMKEEGLLPDKAGALVVAEPTGNIPILGHKGVLWLTCTARGKSAHGSMPDLGDNAIYKAARAALSLEDFFSKASAHPQLGKPTVNVGTFAGGSKINMVPDVARFDVDLRSVPGVDHSALLDDLKRHLGPDMEVDPFIDLPGILTPPEDPWIEGTLDIMANVVGSRPTPGYVNYFTDASVLFSAMGNPPTLLLGPGEPSQAHQTDEYCLVEKIGLAARCYLAIAREWVGTTS